jgi:hypothetical protein
MYQYFILLIINQELIIDLASELHSLQQVVPSSSPDVGIAIFSLRRAVM